MWHKKLWKKLKSWTWSGLKQFRNCKNAFISSLQVKLTKVTQSKNNLLLNLETLTFLNSVVLPVSCETTYNCQVELLHGCSQPQTQLQTQLPTQLLTVLQTASSPKHSSQHTAPNTAPNCLQPQTQLPTGRRSAARVLCKHEAFFRPNSRVRSHKTVHTIWEPDHSWFALLLSYFWLIWHCKYLKAAFLLMIIWIFSSA